MKFEWRQWWQSERFKCNLRCCRCTVKNISMAQKWKWEDDVSHFAVNSKKLYRVMANTVMNPRNDWGFNSWIHHLNKKPWNFINFEGPSQRNGPTKQVSFLWKLGTTMVWENFAKLSPYISKTTLNLQFSCWSKFCLQSECNYSYWEKKLGVTNSTPVKTLVRLKFRVESNSRSFLIWHTSMCKNIETFMTLLRNFDAPQEKLKQFSSPGFDRGLLEY